MTTTRTTTTKPAPPAEPFKPGASYRRVLEKSHRRAVRVVLASRDLEQLDTLPTIERSHRG